MRNTSSRCFSRPGKNAGTILDASAIPKRKRSLKQRLKLLAACARPSMTTSRAVKRSGGPRADEERTMGEHSSALLVSILPTTPPCSSERKAVRSPWSAVAHHLRSGPKCYWLCHCMRKSPQRQQKSDNDKQGAGVSCQITTKRCLQENNARH